MIEIIVQPHIHKTVHIVITLCITDMSSHFIKVPNKACTDAPIYANTTWGPESCAMICLKYDNCAGIMWKQPIGGNSDNNCLLVPSCQADTDDYS